MIAMHVLVCVVIINHDPDNPKLVLISLLTLRSYQYLCHFEHYKLGSNIKIVVNTRASFDVCTKIEVNVGIDMNVNKNLNILRRAESSSHCNFLGYQECQAPVPRRLLHRIKFIPGD